jgi:hypothetical protein
MSLLFPSSSPPGPDRRLPEGKRLVPVIGWRSWKLRRARDDVLLQSVFGSDCWEVGITCARCRRWPLWMPISHQAVPGTSCECGLYAFSSAAGAIHHTERQLAGVFASCGQPPPVVGAVVGWGRVVQHGSQGWRAEYARPIALLNMGPTLLNEAALHYGLPLLSMRGLCLLPLEYGEALVAA